jgi:hypothetical protein
MAANSLHRTARPRKSNTVDANIIDLWNENNRLRTLLEQRQVLPPPLEMIVTVGPGQQRTVQIVNTETGGMLTTWGPA